MQESESQYGHVRKSWQRTFKMLDQLNAADKPSMFAVQRSKEFKALSFSEKFKIGFKLYNITATLFGPFYYLFKGMWLKSVVLFTTIFLLGSIFIVAELLTIPKIIEQIIDLSSLSLSCLCGILASHDYYLLKTQNEKTWRTLPKWINHPAGAITTLIASILLFTSPFIFILMSLQ